MLQHLDAFSFSQFLILSTSLKTLKDLSYGKGFSELSFEILLLEEKGKLPQNSKTIMLEINAKCILSLS